MRGGVEKDHAGHRSRAPGARSSRKGVSYVCVMLAGLLAATGLAACGTSSASTGPVTLNFYFYPDVSGATVQAINNCNAQAHGKYTISYQVLPQAADNQRLEMVRRLAAHDSSMDILGLDVTWEAEFAQAGWIEPWTGKYKAEAEDGTLVPALDTAIWKGKLYAVPDNSNTQLLWYNSALTPTPPKTWAQMLADAAKLKAEGKPHYIEIQGAQYEGATVWFNTMSGQRGRHRAEPGRDQGDAGRTGREGTVDHAPARHRRRGRPVAGRADGEPEPARVRSRHGCLRAELPVRVSVHESG